jgi:tRNA (Thr-GGU) A37 N-methylase
VKILRITGRELEVGPLEALDGTPVVDIKPVLAPPADC